ncbi:ARF7 effector protein C-terminus [Desmophyllum pertusum]|uniref:ARF7 effector protein C-terminus n=1 Tax=Desmophyllum pertusum TaxID=174260 RepID=A0A9X0CZX0_9CNID|nr:ARF7 effector protein C-terminus [Desmophyllum pertusum]
MESKCLFETRGESVCSESSARLIKLSECRNNIDDQLQKWHLSQLKGTVEEYELILNRSGLPHDLSSDQLERLWICEKHRDDMGRNWRPRCTCQYPLHPGRKKQLKTRNAVNLDMSREINTIYGKHVPTGSRKSDLL